MKNNKLYPESHMMSYGYKPELSQGAIKSPIFQTSTFVFNTAEEGKRYFEIAYGLKEKEDHEEQGLIYSRLNNPDLEILENRLCLWDGAKECAVFQSGMSAISSLLLEFLKPGDLLLYSTPVYGGSHHFINHFLKKIGVHVLDFMAGDNKKDILNKIKRSGHANNLALIYIETPANPTNALIDISMCREIADKFSDNDKKVYLSVDNTYMGPVWSQPLKHGADMVIYSATKYIGGHSDVIAGTCLGNKEIIGRMKVLRTFLGNMPSPWTSWLLMRSLETLKIRMEAQAQNAKKVAEFLKAHALVEKIYYLGDICPDKDPVNYAIFKKQYTSTGAMISFDIKGGEKEAFTFLNNLKLIKLAVSLGSTESLAEHPYTMTHADISEEEKNKISITDKLIRISVGIENQQDLIEDIKQAFNKVIDGPKSDKPYKISPIQMN